MTGILLRSLGL